MPEMVRARPSYPMAQLRIAKEIVHNHTLRVLLDSGRIVETVSPNKVVHAAGVQEFTCHDRYDESGRRYHVFADKHGWALTSSDLQRLMNENKILPLGK